MKTAMSRLHKFNAVPLPAEAKGGIVWLVPSIIGSRPYIECGHIVAKTRTEMISFSGNSSQTIAIRLPPTAIINWNKVFGEGGVGVLEHISNEDFGIFID